MLIKLAINGFGRIGRQVFKHIENNHPNLEVVAVNDLTDTKTLAHLLKHDSTYGDYGKEIKATEKSIIVAGKEVPILSEKDPEKLPWKSLKVDIVLECTGFYTDELGARKHITAGAKKVICAATHGLFLYNCLDRLRKRSDHIFATDSIISPQSSVSIKSRLEELFNPQNKLF